MKISKTVDYALPGIILVLSAFSATGICKEACSSLSDYRLFGTHFAVGGIAYASLLLFAAHITRKVRKLKWTLDLLILAGLGAELWFLIIQKVVVQKWCPVCLSIAVTLSVFALWRGVIAWQGRSQFGQLSGSKRLLTQLGCVSIIALTIGVGFVVALVSVGQKQVHLSGQAQTLNTALASAEPEEPGLALSKKDIWFGSKEGRYEVYFITDWYCGFCRELEPGVEKMLPELGKKARYTWIDLPTHRESLNVAPFAMNVLLKEKGRYLKARHALYDLTKAGKEVGEMQVRSALEMAGVKASAIDMESAKGTFLQGVFFCRKAGVNQTPAAIIVDRNTGERKVMNGIKEVSRENIFKLVNN